MTMQLFSRFLQAKILLAAALLIASPATSAFSRTTTGFGSQSGSDREVFQLGADGSDTRTEGSDSRNDGSDTRTEGSDSRNGGSATRNVNSGDLLVRSMAQTNPSTPIELAKAVGLMIDIGRFEEANGYLNSLSQLDIDGEASYELNRVVGSEVFYGMARIDQLQPVGREFALSVFGKATQWANSDQRIETLIKELGVKNEYARGEAFAKLNRVGHKAVARLLETFSDLNREDEFPALRGALYAFGDAAVGPLLGAVEADNASVRIEAIRALAKQESNEAVDKLLRISLSQLTQSPYRELASYHLQKSGRAPERTRIEERLAGRVEKFFNGGRVAADSLFGKVNLWTWNDDTGKLEVSEVDANIAAQVRAADLAQTLFEINPQSARNRELHLLAQLESRKGVAGPSKSIDVDAFLEQADNVSVSEVERLLVRAIDLDMMLSATAACEVLKQIGDQNLLFGGQLQPLVSAILVGDRHLQFAAFDAIAEFNPQRAYAGSSYVSELAAFLASSRFRKTLTIGHNRSETAQAWASAAVPLGWESTAATSSQDFFEKAKSSPDVAILIVSDTLNRPDHRALLQQLRGHWKTRRMPIGLLARDANHLLKSVRHTEGFDRLLTFPLSVDSAAISGQLEQLGKQESPWTVSSDDRYRHAARAVQWLEVAAVDPQLDFYHFGAHQEEILGLLYHPEFTSSAAKILATQPTASAQRAMLGFVSQGELPIEARELVADAFESAVKRGGTMLTTREIQLQYERYNASENQPEETQKVLGRVLDVIEARRNRAK